MPYAEGRVMHDADSHVVETPDWLVPYADPDIRGQLAPLFVAAVKPGEETYIDQLRRRHADPAERPQAEDEIMLRKNWSAMGSFIKEDRPRALDLLGFRSQLVFNTFLNDYLCAAEHKQDTALAYGVARAHNRAMLDFCAVDPRLLPTGYVPLADFDRARAMAGDVIAAGARSGSGSSRSGRASTSGARSARRRTRRSPSAGSSSRRARRCVSSPPTTRTSRAGGIRSAASRRAWRVSTSARSSGSTATTSST